MNTESGCRPRDPRVAAVALGRWCLGLMFLVFGVGKFIMGVNEFVTHMSGPFEKTWLPSILVRGFGYFLPVAEVILGTLLLLGLFRNVALFCTGLLLIALMFGQAVLGQAQVVFSNTTYVFMTAGVLFLANWDRWVLFPRHGRADNPVQNSQVP